MIRHISPNGDHFETRHRRRDGSLLDVDIVTNMAMVGGQKLIFCVCRDITTRKRAELELLQSEERFRTLVEAAPEPVFVQTDGKFAYLNPAAHHLFGLEDGDELLGESVVEYFHPDSRKSVELRLQTLQQERKSVPRVAEKIVRLDGRVMDVEVSAAPFVYDGKEGAVIFAHDITARRQAEHALDRQRAMLQAVVDHMPAGLTMYEGEPLRPTLSNRQSDRLLGRDLPDRIAQGQLAEYFQVFLAGTDEPYPTERMPVVRAFEGEVATIDDMEILQPDGTRVQLEVRGTPIRDAEGRIVASLAIFQDITERKRAEKALRDSETRFRMLFEEATEGIVLADSETGEILDCNRAFEDLSEYRREELLGRPQAMLHVPEEIDGHLSSTFIAHRGPRLGEILVSELLTKSGACKTVEIKANVLKIGSRNVLQGFFRDVTEHVRHRREREMTLELLRLLNEDNSLEALLEQVTRYLQEWTRCEAVGIRLKEGSDFPYYVTRGLDREFVRLEMSLCARDGQGEVLVDDDGAVLECMCGRVLRGETRAQAPPFTPKGSFWSVNLQDLVARHGRYTPAALDGLRHRCIHEGFRSVALIPLHHGNSTIGLIQIVDHAPDRLSPELISFLENVADQVAMAVSQRQSQESLRLSEQRLRDISDAAGEFIWELDSEYHIVYASDRVEAVVGYCADELTNRYFYDFVPSEAHTQVHELLTECIKKPQAQVTCEAPAVAKDGRTVWLQVTAKSVLDASGEVKGYRGAALDITEKKQAQEEREKLEAQLFQAQKMESIGRLAGGVAHDFNNMLCVITGNTQLALSSLEPDHPLVQELADIQEAARRSADLTRQLLAFARKQTVSPKPLDLNDTIGGMTKMLRRLIGEDIDLVWTPGNALWRVFVDPAQIDQLLANLVVNARDAIPGTGAIVLHTANERLDAMEGEPDFVPGDYVMLSIRDTGVGMSDDVLERIFEPFFTTKELGKGTGLGLATVYGIVKQNNGFIRVSSQLHQGSTFTVYLPRFDAVEESDEDEMDARQLPHGEETILLVEDELPVLKLGARILSRLGYTVLEAQDPRRALEAARDHAGEIHLVLTDVVMPDLNGRELVEQVRALRPDVKCLYMSGYTADVIAHRGVLEDGLTFLQKPFTMSDLAERVRRALDSAE